MYNTVHTMSTYSYGRSKTDKFASFTVLLYRMDAAETTWSNHA